jgi:hypothetical protein
VFAKPSPSNLESIRLFGYRHVFSPASTFGMEETSIFDSECMIDGNLGSASGLCLKLHAGDVEGVLTSSIDLITGFGGEL